MIVSEKQILAMFACLTPLAQTESVMMSEAGRQTLRDLLQEIVNQQSEELKDFTDDYTIKLKGDE